MSQRTTVCVFAKRPLAGKVKTRLAAELGAAYAAELASCFLSDTLTLAESRSWADVVLATTDEPWARQLVGAARAWPQGSGDLGERLERVLRRALSRGPSVIALGSDSPGLPAHLLDEARQALSEHDAAIGPSEDGGFYLLGLNRCPEGLLCGLPWSAPNTLFCTLARLQARGLSVAQLSSWFDVDVPLDLKRLTGLLRAGVIDAPVTAARLGVARSGAAT
jgi:uncharacterized protein